MPPTAPNPKAVVPTVPVAIAVPVPPAPFPCPTPGRSPGQKWDPITAPPTPVRSPSAAATTSPPPPPTTPPRGDKTPSPHLAQTPTASYTPLMPARLQPLTIAAPTVVPSPDWTPALAPTAAIAPKAPALPPPVPTGFDDHKLSANPEIRRSPDGSYRCPSVPQSTANPQSLQPNPSPHQPLQSPCKIVTISHNNNRGR